MPIPSPITDEVRILTPNAMLGYGYISEHFWFGIKQYRPHAIIVDSGSTDGGPYKLGIGKMTCSRESYERDLGNMLDACFHHGCKVLIGSAGGSGSDRHVDELLDIIRDISSQRGYSFKVATIKSGVDRGLIKSKLASGQIRPCGPVEDLTEEEIVEASDIVAQIGSEPYLKVLADDPDIIVAGRSYDPAPFAAFAMYHGMGSGPAWHCGKIMECGGICAVPKGRSMLATVRKDHFELVPLNILERCTPLSVAAHTLYEKTRPDILPGPGGELHLDKAQYTQLGDGRTVRISGAVFKPTPYEVKLEGARIMGYRTVFIGGVRDPILVNQIDKFLKAVHAYTCGLFPALAANTPHCQLLWHVYGKNAVMGPLEPVKHSLSHELGVLGEVTAPTQELASAIANNARVSCLHMPYEGQLATTGNFASPLTPLEQPCGPVCRFSIYHLMRIEDPSDFPVKLVTFAGHTKKDANFGLNAVVSTLEKSVGVHQVQTKAKPFDPSKDQALVDFAKVIRSKNSGPFEITFDIMFDEPAPYEHVKASGVLTRELVARLYSLKDEDIIYNGFFDAALAWKCTIVRPWAQGTIGERDTLGTAQHAPLVNLVIPAHHKPNGAVHNETAKGLTNGQVNGSHPLKTGFSPTSTPSDSVSHIWAGVGLAREALDSLSLPSQAEPVLPSSYKIGHLAQASVALATLAASAGQAERLSTTPSHVSVDMRHASIEFKSERLTLLNSKPPPSPWGPIAGLYKVADGYVRIHDSFTNHREGTAKLLGCAVDRAQIAEKLRSWKKIDFEEASIDAKLANYALRSKAEWAAHPQAGHPWHPSAAINPFPVEIERADTGAASAYTLASVPRHLVQKRPLAGLRVLELSRVIAAPLAGRTLAAHGADVLWITSPNLPDLPGLDRDFARGKRTASLDLNKPADADKLRELLKTADVFLQSYRPGALEAKGFGPEAIRRINPSIVYATMSAWGTKGPWAKRRGYDSLVQTASGMNVEEAIAAGKGDPAMPTPVQALDHAGGYLLAFGVMAALLRRAREGGSYTVSVSLAQVMSWLVALGQLEDGFDCFDPITAQDVSGYLESKDSGLGPMSFVKHSGHISGSPAYWDVMPKPLGSDAPAWV